MHIKGSSIEYKGKAFLILGRGEAGKTEFAMTLCKHGAKLMGNTHVLVDGNHIFGIKSNIRVRDSDSERYISVTDNVDFPLFHSWAPVGSIFWVQYRLDGKNIIERMDEDCAYQNLRWFTEAIGNWEMKEDIADYVNSNPFQFSKYMETIDGMLRRLCNDNLIYYMNLDIHSSEGGEKVIDLIDAICASKI